MDDGAAPQNYTPAPLKVDLLNVDRMFSRVSVFGSFAPQIGPPRPRVRDNQLPRVRFIDNGPGPRSGDRNRIDFLSCSPFRMLVEGLRRPRRTLLPRP